MTLTSKKTSLKRRGGLLGSRGVRIASVRLAIVLVVASFAAAVHDALFDVVESMMVFSSHHHHPPSGGPT